MTKPIKESIILKTLESSKRWHQGDKWRFSISFTQRLAWKNQLNNLNRAIELITFKESNVI